VQRARKTVTVLFSDVSGFTTLAERLDPESVQQLMGRYFGEMRRVIERHGGTVEKFIGDAVMALFGVPVVHEDDALRAARAALEMRAALDALNDELESRWDVRLSTHTGLNTGEVVVGAGAGGEPLAYGDALNVAQRLEGSAAAGEILVGAATARLIAGAARVEEIDPLFVRGREGRVAAWRLHDVSEERAAAATARALVGRDDELGRLRDAFAGVVAAGRPRLVTIVGAAGIGKSRLARALLDEVAGRATTVGGRCLPYGEGVTYWPVAEIVRRAAGGADEAAIAALAGGGAEGAAIAARIARAVGFSPGSVAVEETHWAVRHLLEIQAARGPLVVVVDDIHWAEPTLLDLLAYLATAAADVPLLLLCLARPELLERRPDWGDLGGRSTIVAVGPLPDAEAAALVEDLAGGDLGAEERERLLATAEGNPLFLEQMVAVRAEAAASGDGPPPTIQALLSARIDALPAAERAVVDRAAVEGRNFHHAAVAELLPPAERPRLDDALAALQRRELIRPAREELPGEAGYRFSHILVRDVAYGLLPKATRAELHEAYAGWLEPRAGGAHGELVGYHLEQAHRCHAEVRPRAVAERRTLGTRAAGHLGTAGRGALAHGDLPAGVNLLERATALLPDDEPARGAMLPELGIALVQLGRLRDADRLLTDAARRATATHDALSESHAVTARFFARVQVDSEAASGELDGRFATLRETFTVAGDELGLSRLYRAEALVHWLAGQSAKAEAAWMRATRHARRAGDEHGGADALVWLASAAHSGPTPVPEAIVRCRRILGQLRHDRMSQALTLRPLASLEAMAGRFDRAQALLDRATAIVDDLGVSLTSAPAHFEAVIALLRGDGAAAEAALRPGYAHLEEMGERALLATTAALVAQAVVLQGRLDEAWRLADVAQEAAAADDLSAQILSRSARAQVLALRGDHAAADRLSAQAVALAARTDWLQDHGDALLVRSDVLRAGGDPEGASAAAGAALELYERKGSRVAAERARAALAAGIAA
jgi:class 3 adenylate cyclase/tetratricopeptide (TPR) repeat protein